MVFLWDLYTALLTKHEMLGSSAMDAHILKPIDKGLLSLVLFTLVSLTWLQKQDLHRKGYILKGVKYFTDFFFKLRGGVRKSLFSFFSP